MKMTRMLLGILYTGFSGFLCIRKNRQNESVASFENIDDFHKELFFFFLHNEHYNILSESVFLFELAPRELIAKCASHFQGVKCTLFIVK